MRLAKNSFVDMTIILVDAAQGTYTLTPSLSVFNVQVSLTNDEVFELSETLTASLSFFRNEAPPRVTISPSSAEVRIEDDDGLYAYTEHVV